MQRPLYIDEAHMALDIFRFAVFLNKVSDQKTSLTKIVQFGMIFENITYKVKVKLSFGHRAVISILSKLNI